MKRGLVLEGGGAKGAFHAGAIKALDERGYKFQGVTGTSIGAINGAFVASQDIPGLLAMWENLVPSQVLDVDDDMVARFISGELKRDGLIYFLKLFGKTIKNRGLSIEKAEKFLDCLIDEKKIRESPVDYGLVTVSVTDKWSPVELFKEEIPEGLLKKYIIASAYFPAFKRDEIDGKVFMDGGIYDNLPINPLIRRGYNEIFAVRTMSTMPHKKVVDSTVTINYIIPSEPLGRTLTFTNDSVKHNLNLGYYDAIRFLDNLSGKKYYFTPLLDEEFVSRLESYGVGLYKEWAEVTAGSGNKRSVIAALTGLINNEVKESFTPFESFITLLEPYAESFGIERFRVYNLMEFIGLMREKYLETGIDKDKFKNEKLNNAVESLLRAEQNYKEQYGK